MDDQTLEIVCSSSVSPSTRDPEIDADQTLDTPSEIAGIRELESSSDLVDTSAGSDDTHGTDFCKGETLPIFRKIEDLSSKVQIIRKEYARLCNEVKGMTAESLVGSEALTAFQNLSKRHELLKYKYSEECEILKRKYLKECSERKKLSNEVIELKGNIRVFCRCRPIKQDEVAKGCSSIVDFESSQENELQIICSDSSRKQFKFDHVFRPEDNQEAVFVQTLPILTSVLDGYNVCIFAYGQTGTGKTFTMEGTPEDRGVNYRTLEELFRVANERSSIIRYELFVSMLEVYNEKIRDLLVDSSNQPTKKLDIKQSAEGTQEVPGLVEARVYDTDEVWGLLKSGSQVRSVGSTNANELSSRSHCLLRVTVVAENLISKQKTRSHLWLVDLAGSERVGRIEVEGDRLKESQFINKSLSALGDVISALASKTTHIPYRNSKLTHMLQSSLGGDCKTLMFVQISPNAADFGETLCSLNFASRVRGIEQGPARKQQDHAELSKYKQLVEKAKQDEKETKKMQDNMQTLQLRLAAREHLCRNLQDKVRDLESQLAEERKIRLKQETRALASISIQSTLSAASHLHKAPADKKPPLAPPKLRPPLRRISNMMPAAPSPLPSKKTTRTSFLPVVNEEKENLLRENKRRQLLKPRRGSIAVRPHPPPSQIPAPKRRSSIATLRPEPILHMTPMATTPLQRSKGGGVMGRQSFVWDPQRMWRASRISSPLPPPQPPKEAVEATPVGHASGSRFRGSPPSLGPPGSWKPRHPTVIALQKKSLVWSPLKLKSMKYRRSSLMS